MYVFVEVAANSPPQPENDTRTTANASTLPMPVQRGLRISLQQGRSRKTTVAALRASHMLNFMQKIQLCRLLRHLHKANPLRSHHAGLRPCFHFGY
jgi:hypothetical protein